MGDPFVRHALLAGGAVGLLCGLVGWFVVVRGQLFAGDALSHVAYAGALGALAAGVDLRLGLVAATVGCGAGLGLLGGRRPADDVVIGTAFAWVLGLGALFVGIYASGEAGGGTANVTVLFGSLFGVSSADARTTALVCGGLALALLLVARPLLLASLEPVVARARGVRVRLLDVGFLALAGATAAQATPVVGALLLLALLAGPPAAALRLARSPWAGLALAAGLGLLAAWGGIGLALAVPTLPPGTAVVAVSAAELAGAALVPRARGRARRPRGCG